METGMFSKICEGTFVAPEEVQPLAQFRARVGKIYPLQDAKLLAWLRARNLSVDKAEQMLRCHLIWRRNNEVGKLILWESPKNFFPYFQAGFDREGAPVFIFPVGQWDLKGCIETGDMVPALKYIYQTLEMVVSAGAVINQFQGTVILDFDGFTYSQIAHRSVLQGMVEVVRVFEANYPEVLKSAFVINAPIVFNVVFALVKPLLNSRTLSKIQIFRQDPAKWQQALFKVVDQSQIPKHWGGTREGNDEFCSDSWLTGPLPPYYFRKIGSSYDEFGEEWFTVKIPAGEKLVFNYKVAESKVLCTKLGWQFYTEGYDVEFSVFFETGKKFVIEKRRVSSAENKQEKGWVELKHSGNYVLTFDNSYSRSRSKTLHYFLAMTKED